MGKKLGLVLSVFVLAGCAQTVEGKAVVADSSQGQGVTPSSSRTTTPTTSSRGVDFDPCGFDGIDFEIYALVDSETKVPLQAVDGCAWTGNGRKFTSAWLDEVDLGDAVTMPGVADLSVFEAGGHQVHLFVYEGDECVAVFEIDGRLAQFSITDDDFNGSCVGLEVTTSLLLENP